LLFSSSAMLGVGLGSLFIVRAVKDVHLFKGGWQGINASV